MTHRDLQELVRYVPVVDDVLFYVSVDDANRLLKENEQLRGENLHLTGIIVRNCDPTHCAPGDARPIEDVLMAAEDAEMREAAEAASETDPCDQCPLYGRDCYKVGRTPPCEAANAGGEP